MTIDGIAVAALILAVVDFLLLAGLWIAFALHCNGESK